MGALTDWGWLRSLYPIVRLNLADFRPPSAVRMLPVTGHGQGDRELAQGLVALTGPDAEAQADLTGPAIFDCSDAVRPLADRARGR